MRKAVNFKKSLALLLLSMLIFSTIIWENQGEVCANATASFSVGQTTILQGTSNASINFTLNSLSSSKGIQGIDYEIYYDSSKLEFVGSSTDFTQGTIFSGGITNVNSSQTGKIIFSWASMTAINSTGKVATLNFRIKDGVYGTASVTAAVTNLIEQGDTLADVASIGRSVTNGSINITKVVPITSVALDQTSLNMSVGEKSTLIAIVNPEDTTESKTVSWTSTNTNVATVSSSGVVTAVGQGNAIITATVGSLSAHCTLEVTKSTDTETENGNTDTGNGNGENTGDNLDEDNGDKNDEAEEEELQNDEEEESEILEEEDEAEEQEEEEENIRELIEVNEFNESTLLIGKEYYLSIKLNAQDYTGQIIVTYMSSDESVVTISEDGVITPLSVGTATITVLVNGEEFESYVVEVANPEKEEDENEEEFSQEKSTNGEESSKTTGYVLDIGIGTTVLIGILIAVKKTY